MILDTLGFGWDDIELDCDLSLNYYRHPDAMPRRCCDCLSNLAPVWSARCDACEYKYERRLSHKLPKAPDPRTAPPTDPDIPLSYLFTGWDRP